MNRADGEVCMRSSRKKVGLEWLTKATASGRVPMCDGVAISQVQRDADAEKNYVPRDSR